MRSTSDGGRKTQKGTHMRYYRRCEFAYISLSYEPEASNSQDSDYHTSLHSCYLRPCQ